MTEYSLIVMHRLCLNDILQEETGSLCLNQNFGPFSICVDFRSVISSLRWSLLHSLDTCSPPLESHERTRVGPHYAEALRVASVDLGGQPYDISLSVLQFVI